MTYLVIIYQILMFKTFLKYQIVLCFIESINFSTEATHLQLLYQHYMENCWLLWVLRFPWLK